MAENWYIVLELDFDPPVEDEAVIAARIEEKRKFWSSNSQHFKNGAQYRSYLASINKIKKDMIGPENIRKQLAAEACAAIYEELDKTLKMVGRKGHITPEEMDKIAKQKNASVDTVKRRAKALGIPSKVPPESTKDHELLYAKYYKTKPQNAHVYDSYKEKLAVFHAETLYEFLFLDTNVKDAQNMPCSKLRERAAELKKTKYYKTDAVSSAGSKLCSDCETAFKDEASKAGYDAYLSYMKCRTVFDEIKNVASISGEIGEEQFEDFVKQLTLLLRDRKLAQDVLTAFCKMEKILFRSATSAAKPDNPNLKTCRCGCVNDTSDGRTVCSNCGLPLVIQCPKCKTNNDNSVKVCKCGFKYENLDKALALCELAEHAIEVLDFEAAKAHISDAMGYWAECPNALAAKKKLAEYEKRVGLAVGKMREAIKAKRYYEARTQYMQICRLFPNYTDKAVEEEVNHAVDEAEKLYRQAKAATSEQTIVELCARAYEYCPDYPGIKELMPVPRPVQGISMNPNAHTCANSISWTVSSDKSIRYVVVRSASGWVRTVSDGEIIYRGSASSFADKNIKPATTYYYNVFAERADMYSQGGVGDIKPVINLFEISSIMVTAADGSLNLVWKNLPEGATADIYEVAPSGTQRLIASTVTSSYLLTGLRNGMTYRYHVKLTYTVNGEKRSTIGMSVTGIPDPPPQPIDVLRIKPVRDNMYEAVWLQEEVGDVRLYSSTNKPPHMMGDMVSLAALEQEMAPVQPLPLSAGTRQELKSNEKGIAFEYSGSQTLYVVAVVIKSGTAMFGMTARVGKSETVQITDVRIVNGKLHIYLNPPAKAGGFVVLYRHDRFPSDISDVQAVRKYIPIKQYQLTNSLVLDTTETRKFYFSVFAEFKYDDDKDYSVGVDYLFDNSAKVNITYSVDVSKKLFGGSSVVLEFEADAREFELPAIDVMSAVGNVPMFKNSAQLFYEIPAQRVVGSVQVRIPFPKNMPRDTYIKAFFKDEASQAGSMLRLKQKSNYKIS